MHRAGAVELQRIAEVAVSVCSVSWPVALAIIDDSVWPSGIAVHRGRGRFLRVVVAHQHHVVRAAGLNVDRVLLRPKVGIGITQSQRPDRRTVADVDGDIAVRHRLIVREDWDRRAGDRLQIGLQLGGGVGGRKRRGRRQYDVRLRHPARRQRHRQETPVLQRFDLQTPQTLARLAAFCRSSRPQAVQGGRKPTKTRATRLRHGTTP